MKTLTTATAEHQASRRLTLAWCWILKRRDGLTLGLTSHVADITVLHDLTPFNPLKCKASSGFTATDIEATDSLAQNNLEITGVVDDDAITEADVRAGYWDDAEVQILTVDYNLPNLVVSGVPIHTDTNTKFRGTIGAIRGGGIMFVAELRGLSAPLEANYPGTSSPVCDAVLGDARCGVDLGPFTETGTVAGAEEDRRLVDAARSEPIHWWRGGVLTLTSGPSAGRSKEIKESEADGSIELVEPFFFGMQDGDTYSCTPGCNHLLVMPDGTITGDCKIKYDNVRRMRAVPYTPGGDKINQYGGQGEG